MGVVELTAHARALNGKIAIEVTERHRGRPDGRPEACSER